MRILDEIQKAEQNSDRRLELARKKREELITKAKKDALLLGTQAQKELEAERKAKIEEKESELAKMKKEISKESQKELDRLERKFTANKEKAVQFLLEKFEEKISDV
ncbi:MAG: hypothetical protein EPN86_02060 [Nanoarchaeota archaeon]|nr:MAG: hypothetical protein EPN86_02060 [Nanoarchaeota archaeon]